MFETDNVSENVAREALRLGLEMADVCFVAFRPGSGSKPGPKNSPSKTPQ